MELISRIPAVKTRRSQPGSVAVNMPAELLLPAEALEPGEDEVAVVPEDWIKQN